MELIHSKITLYALMAGLVLAFAALSALAFAGWLSYGAEILLTMSETALSYCF